ncbi:uncharacterized protein LOC144133366 isoform X2 [Amblyomma americanum]
MGTSRQDFSSLFEMVAASGLCPVPSEINVLDDSGPCDESLLDVLHQLEALVTGDLASTSKGFKPSSNLVAMLVIGWLVARRNALEILLERIISPTGTVVTKKPELSQQPQPQQTDGISQDACRLAWSRLRLSLKSLAAAMQQHAYLLHQAHQWLPRGGQQQCALKAYLRWTREDQAHLWQALLGLKTTLLQGERWTSLELKCCS